MPKPNKNKSAASEVPVASDHVQDDEKPSTTEALEPEIDGNETDDIHQMLTKFVFIHGRLTGVEETGAAWLVIGGVYLHAIQERQFEEGGVDHLSKAEVEESDNQIVPTSTAVVASEDEGEKLLFDKLASFNVEKRTGQRYMQTVRLLREQKRLSPATEYEILHTADLDGLAAALAKKFKYKGKTALMIELGVLKPKAEKKVKEGTAPKSEAAPSKKTTEVSDTEASLVTQVDGLVEKLTALILKAKDDGVIPPTVDVQAFLEGFTFELKSFFKLSNSEAVDGSNAIATA